MIKKVYSTHDFLETSTALTQKELIPIHVYKSSNSASYDVARHIAQIITDRAKQGRYAVLGLATGSSPTKVYDYLISFHREEGLSFKNVVTFNLDEYYPMDPGSLQSYVRFMHAHLYDHIDIPPENIHIPDGTIDIANINNYCAAYEDLIQSYGGIDLQLLGIGRTGHVGFNEPGSSIQSKTRLIRLDKVTMLDAASDFFGIENVPARAITMGVGTIMDAKEVILLAWGEGKAAVIKEAVEGEIVERIPASYLQRHPNCRFFVDLAAGQELTRIKTPWLLDDCTWDDHLMYKACIWLSQKTNKVILKLTNEDYNEYGMGDLVARYNDAEEINLIVFNRLQRTITGWPGGKPNADDAHRPERAEPHPKRSIIFSPHPDDDVISMGGTLLRLADHGHEVHVAYQTSGNIAVYDDEVIRFLDFTRSVVRHEQEHENLSKVLKETRDFLSTKKPGEIDSPDIQRFKGLIRKGEALAACRYCGVAENRAHFLNMPFYETGTVKKKLLSQADIDIIKDLLETVKPHQIFAAGDLSDPHGTHRVCLQAIYSAIDQLKDTASWLSDCYVWLYRGAWQEWGIDEIEMAVPLSPRDLKRKRNAIFKHQSQKDSAMFPGNDSREFWERAEDRNKETASIYNALGLAEYEAVEAFVRYHY